MQSLIHVLTLLFYTGVINYPYQRYDIGSAKTHTYAYMYMVYVDKYLDMYV